MNAPVDFSQSPQFIKHLHRNVGMPFEAIALQVGLTVEQVKNRYRSTDELIDFFVACDCKVLYVPPSERQKKLKQFFVVKIYFSGSVKPDMTATSGRSYQEALANAWEQFGLTQKAA